MKNRISLLLAGIMLLGSTTLFAQKPFVGDISFGLSAEGTTDVNITSQLATISSTLTVMGNCTKNVISAQGVGQIQITNGDYYTVISILDLSSMNYGKYYMEMNKDSIEKEFAMQKFDYNYTEEEKTIAGCKCKKVVVTITDLESDEQTTQTLWVTNDLMLGDNINFSTFPGLKGFPMRTEIKQEDSDGNSFIVVQEATTLTPNKKVKSTNFLRPSDAKPATEAPAEVKQMLGVK